MASFEKDYTGKHGQQNKKMFVLLFAGSAAGEKRDLFSLVYKSVRRQKYTVGAETAPKPEQTHEKIPFPSTFFCNAYIVECQAVGMTVIYELGKDIKSTGHDLHLLGLRKDMYKSG